MPKLGAKVNPKNAIQGVPPVVLAVQPSAYFVIDTPAELKQWENDVRSFAGISNVVATRGCGTESCSGLRSDDSDMAQ